MLSDWCLGFLIKILLKSVIITGFVRQCFVYFLFKHVALPVIHHKLMQFIGMSSSKWKSSYDKGRIHNSNGKRHFYGAPFVKILYLTDLAQKVLSLRKNPVLIRLSLATLATAT